MLDAKNLHDIFFIYHPSDLRFVRHLEARLRAKGADCYVNVDEPGDSGEGQEELQAGILRSHLVVMVLSPQAAESPACNALIQFAVDKGKRFASLIVDEDIEADVHPAIADHPYIFFRQQDVLEDGIQALQELMAANRYVKLHTELLIHAANWEQGKRASHLLLPSERIHRARQWLAEGLHQQPEPSELQREYIHASHSRKPAARYGLLVYLALALGILIVSAVVIASLQNAAASQAAATETAVGIAGRQTETQLAQAAAVSATAEATDSALVLADIATSSASIKQTVQADAPPQTTAELPATPMLPSGAESDAPPILLSAEGALEAGAADLALALALAAAESLDDPSQAYRILSRAAASSPTLTLHDVALLRFNPAGGEFALIPRSLDRVLVYDTAARTLKYELTDYEQDVVSLAYSLDGQFLITGAQDGELVIRSSADGAPLHRLRRHQGSITAMALYPAGNRLVTAGAGPMLVSWDIHTGDELGSYSADEGAELLVEDLLVTADAARIIAWSNVGGESVMSQWSADSLDLLTADSGGQVYRGYHPAGGIAFSGGRALPAYAGDPNMGDLIFWDLTSAQPISRLTDGFNWSVLSGGDLAAATDSLLFIAFQDETALLGIGSSAGGQRSVLVNIADGTALRSYEHEAELTWAHFINAQTLLSATRDHRLVLWSSEDGTLLQEVGLAPQPLRAMMVNAAGDAVLGQANDGTAYLWSVAKSPPALEQVLADAASGTALNQSGTALLIVRDSGVTLQNTDTQRSMLTLTDSRIARMNPGGSHFVIHSENRIAVYDAASGAEQSTWTVNSDDIQDLALAPTGDAVLFSTRGGELWQLEPDSERARRLPASGLGPAWRVEFAADGSLFLTLHDERAILWERATASPRQGYPLGVPPDFPLTERVDIALSPAGDRLYFFVRLDDDLAGLTIFSLDDGSVSRHTFTDVQHGELTPDGAHLLLASSDHRIQIIDTSSGAVLHRLSGHQDVIRKLHYQSESGRLLSAGDDNSLNLWDVEAAALQQRYLHPKAVVDFSLGADTQRILSRDSAGVYRLWQVESLPELIDRIQSTFSPRDLTCGERQQYHVLPLCE